MSGNQEGAAEVNQAWTRHLPEILREWLAGRQQLQKTIGNTGWLLLDRILRMVIGLTIGAWVARYLGPVQFGQFAYVLSFVAFFQVIAGLEADGFIVRDIAQQKTETSVILGTALWLRIILGGIAWVSCVVLMYLLHPEDKQLLWLTLIVGGSIVFQSADTIDLWFQSQSQSRRTVLTKAVVYVFSNGLKVSLLVWKAPLIAFAGVITFEAAASAVGLAIAYRRFAVDTRWKATLAQARSLLNFCWPFAVSGLMITTYMRVDQIMLKEMLGEHELGLFAAVLPLSQTWAVLPATLVTSLAPFVATRKAQDERVYQDVMVKVFRFFALMALLGAAFTTLASPWIISLLYGPQYQTSARVLSAHVFVNLFVFQGLAQSLWVVNNNVRSVTLIGACLSAMIGVLANLVLIREFGIMGAVYSILLVQCISVVVIPCLLRKDLLTLYRRAFIPFGSYGQQ